MEHAVGLHCSHPYKFVSRSLRSNAPSARVSLVYFNINYPFYGDDNTHEYDRHQFNHDIGNTATLNAKLLIPAIPANAEVGLASRISVGPNTLVLPMIDFTGRPPINRIRNICDGLSAEHIGGGSKYRIYDSGNSYHAYFDTLMTEGRASVYLSALRSYDEVDQKWVAHSLRGKFGAVLRWTCRTGAKGFIREVREK